MAHFGGLRRALSLAQRLPAAPGSLQEYSSIADLLPGRGRGARVVGDDGPGAAPQAPGSGSSPPQLGPHRGEGAFRGRGRGQSQQGPPRVSSLAWHWVKCTYGHSRPVPQQSVTHHLELCILQGSPGPRSPFQERQQQQQSMPIDAAAAGAQRFPPEEGGKADRWQERRRRSRGGSGGRSMGASFDGPQDASMGAGLEQGRQGKRGGRSTRVYGAHRQPSEQGGGEGEEEISLEEKRWGERQESIRAGRRRPSKLREALLSTNGHIMEIDDPNNPGKKITINLQVSHPSRHIRTHDVNLPSYTQACTTIPLCAVPLRCILALFPSSLIRNTSSHAPLSPPPTLTRRPHFLLAG
jgi:hypothetical protein